ncbi:hypothetical protein PRK78_007527 [Emydomyces testavorans]|uniref:Uncharacterized protein n=1 Tax=Emydomyces testavorans TaxID=2070801 RepID=A0AAF0DNV2_9EURO|nr:hypothetical protein PRK78_007527 [Emydomyces testavorans]
MRRRSLLATLIFSSSALIPTVSALTCASDYEPCFANGADPDASPPSVRDGMVGFYEDLVSSVEGHSLKKRDGLAGAVDLEVGGRGASGAGRSGMQCLLLKNRKLSFCWDRFTTNYYLPDSSHGSITTGLYTTPSQDTVNLILGNYTLSSGTTGNIYSSAPDSKPNPSTLHLPSPFTAKGDGTAIPGSELGAPARTVTVTGTGGGGGPATATATGSSVVTVTVSGGAAAAPTKKGDATADGHGRSGVSLAMGVLVAAVFA